jgi:hypothetical protein
VNCTGAPLALALGAQNRSWQAQAQAQEQERCSSVQEPELVAQQRRSEWIRFRTDTRPQNLASFGPTL